MGRQSRQKVAQRTASSSASRPSASSARTRETGRKHRWLARLAAATLVPLVLLCAVEGVLRLCGYGYSTRFFVPAGNGRLTTNPHFAWQYYPRKTATSPVPLLFPKQKSAGTKRIFILGESAAAGTPDPAFGFWRMLDVMLRDQFPGERIEIINAAMRGIDSHIIRTIANECAALSPDLFIVYAGNNDMIGLHAPSPGEFTLVSGARWLRFKHALNRLKIMQLGTSLLSVARKDGPEQDQAYFRKQRLAFDDSRRESVYRNYDSNLREICAQAQRAGALTLLCTVAVNLRDFPPLASLHRAGLSSAELAEWEKLYAEGSAAEAAGNHAAALAKFEQAARLDDHFAELLFRLARCHEALGQFAAARQRYALARDWDALQFRTDSRMNGLVRSTATNTARVRLLDAEEQLGRSLLAQNGVAGRRIFQEHVHFTFDGDYEMAVLLAPAVAELLKLPSLVKPLLSRADCARALAYTSLDDFNVKSSIVRMLGNPPFLDQLDHAVALARMNHEIEQRGKGFTMRDVDEVSAIYRAAITARPDDGMLKFNYGNLLSQLSQPAAAVPYFADVVQEMPGQLKFRIALANALVQSGKPGEARGHFEAALRIDPEFKPAKDALKLLKAKL